MSESKKSHRNLDASERQAASWKTVHHHWWFWLGLLLMLSAMTVYVLSDNLSFLAHN